ncbi:peptidase [Palaeococcus pacificus DY20341]|uniref:Peptidase n=1 Tax=Palaeococcus pacificus DY20341 TaxID=1343739 RepID=A0A075LTG2_9EURY|nr:M20/M25/M40 family metallo-hydrolase [Palaeococcus pacificus]AIF69252.1 peptidase [Palaeococcus pacificus DY20341]
MLELLKELVAFETVNDPSKGKRPSKECPLFIKDTLESWGIESELAEREGYYAVYGEIGVGEPKIMFMAHFDVVPVNLEEWKTDPFKLTIIGDRTYGRGSADDKGNVAAVMLALKELARKDLKGKVLFAFTGDEEIGGRMAMHMAEMLKEEGNLPKYQINADGIGMNPIIRRRKGFGAVVEVPPGRVKIKGGLKERTFKISTPIVETRHAAYFLPGVDAHPLIALSHFLRSSNALAVKIEGKFLKSNVVPSEVTLTYVEPNGADEIEADLGLTTLLKTVVPLVRTPIKAEKYSDYGVSITPNIYRFEDGMHKLYIDVRAMSHSPENIKSAFEEVLKFNLPNARLIFKNNPRAGYLFTSPESPLVKAILKTLEGFGERVKLIEGPGASDSRYFTPYGVEAIDFGPRGGNIHGPNEYAEVKSLKILPKVYEKIALELLRA